MGGGGAGCARVDEASHARCRSSKNRWMTWTRTRPCEEVGVGVDQGAAFVSFANLPGEDAQRSPRGITAMVVAFVLPMCIMNRNGVQHLPFRFVCFCAARTCRTMATPQSVVDVARILITLALPMRWSKLCALSPQIVTTMLERLDGHTAMRGHEWRPAIGSRSWDFGCG